MKAKPSPFNRLFFSRALQATLDDDSEYENCTVDSTSYYEDLRYTVIEKTCHKWEGSTKLECSVTVHRYDSGDETIHRERCQSVSTDPEDTPREEDSDTGEKPGFDDVADCNEAFASFSDTYSTVKSELDSLLGTLENPAQFGLQGAQLKAGDKDEKSAVVLELTPEEQSEGFEVSGRIAGGANDSMVLLTASMAIKIDQNQMMLPMPGRETPEDLNLPVSETKTEWKIAADLDAKLIEMFYSASHVETGEDWIFGESGEGSVLVSTGEDQFVEEKEQITVTVDQDVYSASSDIRAELRDENTLSFEGSFAVGGQTGQLAFQMVRQEDGACVLEDKAFTMPEFDWGKKPAETVEQ